MLEAPTTTARMPVTSMRVFLEQPHHAPGGARTQAGTLLREQPGVGRMKAIDVLGGIDGVHDLGAVETLGQRQLQQDAIDRVVTIEPVDEA